MTSRSLNFLLYGEDVTASKAFAKVAKSAEESSARVDTASKSMGKGVTGALGAGALVVAGADMLKMAGDFQQSTNVLVTAAGESSKNLELIRKGILNIATTTGTSWQQVTDGMYVLEKAGYRGADALKVEMAAAQGAREEGAQLGTVTNALTSIMASYHLKAADAVMVTNEMKTAAGESKTTFENFAGSLSTVLPLASANKISFADVAGSLASLTQHGTSADEATQELANTIRNLAAPNAVAIKEMWQLGISSIDVSSNLGKRGLAGTVEYLSTVVKSKTGPDGTLLLSTLNASKAAANDVKIMFDKLAPATQKLAKGYEDGSLSAGDYVKAIKGLPGSQNVLARQFKTTEDNARGFQTQLRQGLPLNQTSTDALKKMTGGMNGLNTTLQLTGESTAGTNERIKRIAVSAQAAGTDVQGWGSTQKLFNVQLDMFKQTAEAAGITLGTKMLPAMSSVAGFAAKNTQAILGVVGGLVAFKGAMMAVKTAQEVWAASTAFVSILSQVKDFQTAGIAALYAIEAATGPVGIAIGAIGLAIGIATKGFGLFGGSAHAQVKPIEDLTNAILEDGDAVGKLTEQQVNQKLSADGAYDAARKLGVSVQDVLQATLGNADAQGRVATAVAKARDAYKAATSTVGTYGSASRAGSFATKQATQAQIDQKKAADVLAGTTLALTGGLKASVQAAKDQATALASLSDAAKKPTKPMDALDKRLSQFDKRHVNVTIGVDISAAMANLFQLQSQINGVMNNAAAIKVGANTGGHLNTHASGGMLDAGWNLVGEQGPELIHSPGGRSRVYTNSDTKRAFGGGGNVYITVNAGMGTNGREIGRQIVGYVEQHLGSGGRANFRGATV